MEWKKVIRRKSIMGILLGLWLFVLFFYVYSYQQSKMEDPFIDNSAMSQEAYELQFKEKIETLVAQADFMSGISIFAETDSFSSSNLQQTKVDYMDLLEVKPISFAADYLEDVLDFTLLNGVVVIAGILVAMTLADEKKRGVRNIIFACEKGRGYLVAHKIGALLLWAAILVEIYYGSCLLTSMFLYKSDIFSHILYPIQSVPMLMEYPGVINIGTFLVLYLGYRVVVLFLIMLIAWTALSFFENIIFAFGMIGGVGILSFLMYQLIGSSHPLNILHYCNLWYQASGVEYFTEYMNLNIASNAVSKEIVIGTSWILIIGLLLGIAFAVGNYKYPCSSSYDTKLIKGLKRIANRIKIAYRKIVERFSITGTEVYKVLVSQKGSVVILVVCMILWSDTDYTEIVTPGYQDLYNDFLQEHGGKVTEAATQSIEELSVTLAEVEKNYVEAMELYEKGELDDILPWSMLYDSYVNERIFLQEITEQTEYLEKLKSARGIDGWYVNKYAYEAFFSSGNTLINITLILGIVLLSSSVFSMENKCGIGNVIRSTQLGRQELFRRKVIVALLLTLLLFATSVMLEWSSLTHIYQVHGFGAPVQSVPNLGFVTWNCTIGTFIIMLYLLKAIMMCVVAMLTCWLTMKTNHKFAIALSFGLCIPELLTLAGMWFFQYVSIVRILSIAPFLLQVQSIEFVLGVCVLMMSIGIWSMYKLYKEWCNT